MNLQSYDKDNQSATTKNMSPSRNLVGLLALSLLALNVRAEHQQPSEMELEQMMRPFQPMEQFAGGPIMQRARRQITMVEPQQAQQQPSSNSGFGFLSNLGPQLEQAKMFTSLFSSNSQKQQSAGGASPEQSGGGPSASQIMSQLTSLVRSSQNSGQQALQSAQSGVQQSTQQAANVQSGLQAALTEMVQGLQRIAMTNPSLLPEVKNLYQSVSSRLSSAGATPSGPIVPAKNGEQLADNIAKVAMGQTNG